MRLTKKKEEYIEELKTNGHIYFVDDILPSNCDLTSRSINKLGELEDIEEELGIDLVTLFKALKDGFYGTAYGKRLIKYPEVYNTTLGVWIIEDTRHMNENYALKDYGKTWALTKEELK